VTAFFVAIALRSADTRSVFGAFHGRAARFAAAALTVAFLAGGCGDDGECTDPKLIGALEFGVLDENGQFAAITDGDLVSVISIQATYGLAPSLRAEQLDPSAPEPSVMVWVDGVLIGANRAGETPDGDAYVLENLGVLFQMQPCCFNCVEATIEAQLVDKNCHKCAGSVTVTLAASGSCPATTHCGCDSSDCVAPLTPTLCAE